MNPNFFASPAAFRTWLAKNHDSASELWVGFHRKAIGKPTMTWNESVDEALCFGWIDGVRKSLDADRYVIRFSPRRERSVWSDKNIRRMEELIAEGRVHASGARAWERKREDLVRRYSFEQDQVELPAAYARMFRARKKAWTYFQAETHSYRRTVTWWVISAKREETRTRRLAILIDHSAKGERIPGMQRP